MASRKRLYEIQTQTKYLTVEALDTILASHSKDIKQYAYIVHDKDTKEDGTPKEPHFHCMLKLIDTRRRSDVASWFSLPEMCVQDSRTGRYESMLSYLIHENAPEKHQYNENEVKANFNYADCMKDIRTKATRKNNEERRNEIVELIASGTIREYNIDDFITVGEYDKYKSHIKNALEYRSIMLERQNTRNMEVIYIYGDGGTGKSTFAESIARERGYSFKRSASERDPLATYKGQDAFVLDDVRGDTFKFQDWMCILDNFQDRPGSSRFRDRYFTECRLLFITATDSIEDFWKELSANRPHEDPHQFYRRVKTVIHMTGKGIFCRRYDEYTHMFGKEYYMENDTYRKFDKHPETDNEQKEKLANSLGIDKSKLNKTITIEKPEGIIGKPIPLEKAYPTIPPEIVAQIKNNPFPYLTEHPEHKSVPLEQF